MTRLQLHDPERQVLRFDGGPRAGHDGVFEAAAKFADIAGPVIFMSTSSAAGLMVWMGLPLFIWIRRKKESDSKGMSSTRSRRGGIQIGITLIR